MKLLTKTEAGYKINNVLRNFLILGAIFLIVIFGPFAFIYIIVVYFAIKNHIQHKNNLLEFATKHVLEQIEDENEILKMKLLLKARLFTIGHSQNVSNLLIGKIKEIPLKIFNYSYTIGSGRNSHTYSFTVSELEIEKTKFPHILLKSRKMSRFGYAKNFGENKDTKINLEEKYKKKFTLYCTENYEIEVLQIFTNDLLDYLIEHGNKFSIEFYDNKIYIYDDKFLRKVEDMKELYTINEKLLENTDGLLDRLSDDFESLHEVYKLN